MPKKRYAGRDITEGIAACMPNQSVITSWAELASAYGNLHPLFHAGTALPLAAYEANRRLITWGPAHEPFRFLVAMLAPSGLGKSMGAKQMRAFSKELWARYRPGREVRDPWIQMSGSVEGVTHELGRFYDSSTKTTPAILYLDELDQFLAHDQSSSVINRLVDGEDYSRHQRQFQRAGEQAHVTIPQPRLGGVFTAVTSNLASVVRPHHLAGGLFGRMWWLLDHPHKEELGPNYAPIHPDPYEKTLNFWLDWLTHLDTQTQIHRERVTGMPLNVQLTESAANWIDDMLWDEVVDHVHEATRISGILHRLFQQTKQLACLYALARGAFEAVDADADAAARFYLKVKLSIEQLEGQLAVSEEHAVAERLADFLERRGENGANRRELYRFTKLGKRDLEEVVGKLKEQERLVMVRYKPQTGRPGWRYFHPAFAPAESDPRLN